MRCGIWILAGGLALAASGCSGPTASSPVPAAEHSAPANPSPASPAAASIDILSVLTVEHEVDVRAQREGLVKQLLVDEGRRVQAGEVLGRLDDRSLQMELQKAQADLLVSQNNVRYKEAENKAKEANLRRQQLMREAGLSSQADLEQAEFEAKATGYEVDSWQALVKSSQAQVQSIQVDLEQTQFRAPFAGIVLRRYIREGQTVAKDDPCFRVSQLGPLEVHFQVPEGPGGKPATGAPVQLKAEEDPNHAYTARIIKVSPTVDPASDSYDVTAQLTGPDLSALSPGMAVHVSWTSRASATKP